MNALFEVGAAADQPGMARLKRRARVSAGVALVLVSAFFALGVDACLQTEDQRRTELKRRADEILPSEARVLVIGYGDCVELAPSPSCSKVVFGMDELDSARRAALVREEARRNGWTVTHSDDAQGGWSVFLKKDGSAPSFFFGGRRCTTSIAKHTPIRIPKRAGSASTL
jgi:hypothetical protein